jgi:hypothetical protein
MQIVEYAPERFQSLQRAASRRGIPGLEYRPFVDYYYATSPWCKLYLAIGNEGTVQGTIGVERLQFEYESREITLGLGTNFHAFQPGIGGYLYMKWMRLYPGALEFGGTEDAHRVLTSSRKWTYFAGVKQYVLNRPFPVYPGDTWWRAAAKNVAAAIFQRPVRRYSSRIPRSAVSTISVQEEHSEAKGLLPRQSPFAFRLAPTAAYLSWRYNTQLPFIRYRFFRIVYQGSSAGYVILSDSKGQVIVAQCDAEDPVVLAYGVLLSVLEVTRSDRKPRTVLLTTSHSKMREIYEQFGFKFNGNHMKFALGNLERTISTASDTANWLINFDWGDLGLLRVLEGLVRQGSACSEAMSEASGL